MNSNTMLRLAVLLCVLQLVVAQTTPAICGNITVPLDRAVVGKELTASGGCSQGGFRYGTTMRIKSWGVFLRPMYYLPLDYPSMVCPEEIVSAFRRSDKMAMLYHRPKVPASFFAKRTPELYSRFLKNPNVKFPCHTVPVAKLFVWKQRTQFVALVRKMVKEMKVIRDANVNCEGVYTSVKNSRTKKEVDVILERHRVANAAINYLHNVAYSNFFCV